MSRLFSPLRRANAPGVRRLSCAFRRAVLRCGLLAAVSGCTSSYTGSRTVVGEQFSLPELSDSSDSVSLRVYESVKGAKVWTAKDCNVSIAYSNAYTNTYFGIFELRDSMTLSVMIEPTETTPVPASRSREGETPSDEHPLDDAPCAAASMPQSP